MPGGYLRCESPKYSLNSGLRSEERSSPVSGDIVYVMKSRLKSENVNVPLLVRHEDSGAEMMYGTQRRELARRANFARAYIARGRTLGNGQTLDPVLASHLGLQEPAK
jgi:hypothetical protein